MNEAILILFSLIVSILLGTSILAIISIEFRNKIGFKLRTIKISALILFALMLVALWLETPTRLGDYVYIERNLNTHKQIIHTNSSCPKIKGGYSVNEVSYYSYTPYVDAFCPKCVYKSDAIKLTKGK